MAALFLVLAAMAIPPLSAMDAKAAVRALESRYHHASSLKAAFFERYSDGKGGGSAESGTVYFSRPGRMRWEYESPEEKLFIVDGTNVWFYVPADRTASRAKIKDSSDWRTPLALLTGKTDFSRLCRTIELVDAATDNKPGDRPLGAEDTMLRCVPRNESADADGEVSEVLIESDPEAQLVRLLVRQPGSLETEFRFANWEENLAIPEAKFHFEPPPNVAVVDEATLAGAIH
ncbi:MAG TPA: outer membrane lipoprotein carrier protein LolA [Candidatus Acidoferrales bacterium]|jgi:outer membrane lipoprotein carrier protein|nr:outer membrane lipoprotein carrier protein LolA [Candidatus Acidoferrales bacterium]